MIFKRSVPPPPAPIAKEKDTVRKVVDYRMEALITNAIAVMFAIGAVATAFELEIWYPLLALALPAVLVIRARMLDQYARREAERLPPPPPKQERSPSVWQRISWWIVRHRMTHRAIAPSAYRGIAVAGVPDAIKLPYQPGEMVTARKVELPVVPGYPYLASDIYWIVCQAANIGLSERGWKFDDPKTDWRLPSGVRLSRSGFRAVQTWLVTRNLAEAKPTYRLIVTPETVAEELHKP